MTTRRRPKREKASDIDELVRKQCCKMPSPKHPTAHRGGHIVCFMWSVECGYEELAECLDHFCYRLRSGAARHALLTTSLPSSSQCCRLAQQPRCLRYIELLTTLSFANAVFKSAQRPAAVVQISRLDKRAWTDANGRCTATFDGASGDAFVTLLSHDRVQLARRLSAPLVLGIYRRFVSLRKK